MTNRRQVSGRSTRAPPPRLRAWGSPGIPRSIDLDCCFCHRCAAVLTNASWSHLAFRLPRDLRSRHPEDRARDVGWGELNTAGAPLGCTEPRKREATGGNGTPVSRSGRRSRVIRRGVPTFNSPLAHVSGWPRVLGSGALSISDRAAVRCARLQVFGCRRRFGVGPPQSPGVRRLSHLSHPSPAQRSLGGDFCSERQLPRLYRSRAASGPVARAKGRRLCMGATSVVTPLKTPRLPLHAPAVGLTPLAQTPEPLPVGKRWRAG